MIPSQIISTFRRKPIWFLFGIIILSRLFFYSCLVNSDFFGDTPSYLHYPYDILKGEVSISRTPLYPYFLKGIAMLSQNQLLYVVIFQSLFSLFTVFLVYRIFQILHTSVQIRYLATLIYGLLPSVISWDKCVLTESLAISFMVVLTYMLVAFIKSPKHYFVWLISLLVLLMIMLRPSFMTLLPIFMVFWVWRFYGLRKERKYAYSGLASIVLCAVLITGYAKLNYKANGYFGVSVIAKYDQLEILIQSDAYKKGEDQEIINFISTELNDLKSSDGLQQMWSPYNFFAMSRVNNYVSTCIGNGYGEYLSHSAKMVFRLNKENLILHYPKIRNGIVPNTVIKAWGAIFAWPFYLIFGLLLWELVNIIYQLTHNHKPWLNIFLWLATVAQIMIVVLFAPSEYVRLFIPVIPMVCFLLFINLDRLFHSMDADKYVTELLRS